MDISGNTLYIKHESGNLGHYFNDHIYSSLAYYLLNESDVDTIFINFTDSNKSQKIELIDIFNKKILPSQHSLRYKNLCYLMIFFKNTEKRIIFNDIDYKFDNLVIVESDRFFKKYTNYLDVFKKLNDNLLNYKKEHDIYSERIDISVLYRNSKDRNLVNMDLLEKLFIQNGLNYKFISLSSYSFIDIVNLFNNSNNIIQIWGCELTYGMFMSNSSKIIELTNIGDHCSWWVKMQYYFKEFGLEYERLHFQFDNGNLILTEKICNHIYSNLKLRITT